MLKKWFNIIKNKQFEGIDNDEKVLGNEKLESNLEEIKNKEDRQEKKKLYETECNGTGLVETKEIRKKTNLDLCSEVDLRLEENIDSNKSDLEKKDDNNRRLEEADAEFIKEVKLRRAKSIVATNIYTNEKMEFKTHSECSRKLKIPLLYIKENIIYGYTEYFGDAINYIGEQLGLSEFSYRSDKYFENGKNPFEIYKQLNDKIFSAKLSEEKRSSILISSKIEPVSMTYSFECLDFEYDDYFLKYKDIIRRTGKKKIELVKKNGEVLEVFKSIEECANYLNIEKSKVQDMLRCGDTKVDRNYIRYSFRKIWFTKNSY